MYCYVVCVLFSRQQIFALDGAKLALLMLYIFNGCFRIGVRIKSHFHINVLSRERRYKLVRMITSHKG